MFANPLLDLMLISLIAPLLVEMVGLLVATPEELAGTNLATEADSTDS